MDDDPHDLMKRLRYRIQADMAMSVKFFDNGGVYCGSVDDVIRAMVRDGNVKIVRPPVRAM